MTTSLPVREASLPVCEGGLTAAVRGPVPFNLLAPTGRLPQTLTAWGRGHLAEVPAGYGFDVLRIPGALARDVVEQMRAAGTAPGPVVVGPSGAEILVRRGSAPRWNAARSMLLRPGTLVLVPPPSVCLPETVAERGWLVPPSPHEAGCPLDHGTADAADIVAPLLQAVAVAELAEAVEAAEAEGAGS